MITTGAMLTFVHLLTLKGFSIRNGVVHINSNETFPANRTTENIKYFNNFNISKYRISYRLKNFIFLILTLITIYNFFIISISIFL